MIRTLLYNIECEFQIDEKELNIKNQTFQTIRNKKIFY